MKYLFSLFLIMLSINVSSEEFANDRAKLLKSEQFKSFCNTKADRIFIIATDRDLKTPPSQTLKNLNDVNAFVREKNTDKFLYETQEIETILGEIKDTYNSKDAPIVLFLKTRSQCYKTFNLNTSD